MTTPQVHHHYHPTHTHHHHHHQTVRSGPVGSTRAPIESTPYPVTTPPGLIQPPTLDNNVEETLEAGAPRRYGPGYSDGEYGSGGSSCGCDCGGPLSSCYGWVKSRCSSHSNTSRPVGGTRVPVGSTTRSVRARAISTSPSTAINNVQPTSEAAIPEASQHQQQNHPLVGRGQSSEVRAAFQSSIGPSSTPAVNPRERDTFKSSFSNTATYGTFSRHQGSTGTDQSRMTGAEVQSSARFSTRSIASTSGCVLQTGIHASVTSRVHLRPKSGEIPNLKGQVRLLGTRPEFDGTYSSVHIGKYLDEKVAIKMIRAVKKDKAMMRKIGRELFVWGNLDHPNVLPLYGYIEDDGYGITDAIISPWVENGSASLYIQTDITWEQRINLAMGVTDGLRYLHGFTPAIVHADLKHANILVDSNGAPLICDFGLVRLVTDDITTGLTTTSPHTGTARYLSYELVQSTSPPTTASDVHALGCVLMELIYSISLYAHIESLEPQANYRILCHIDRGNPPSSRPDNTHGASSILWDIFEACWNKEPARRPTAEDIYQYLVLNIEEILADAKVNH